MRKSLIAILGVTLLVSLVAVTAINAQTTQTTTVTKVQTVQNADGTYTIVEYPVGKETVVTLNPIGIAGATGTATILRDANGSTIKLNLTSLPADLAALNLYAVDPTGVVTTLGPVEIANGLGTFTTTTPLTRFMLVASPEATLTAYDANTKIFFRSAVPTGFVVIPISKDTAVGEQVAAVVPTAVVPTAVVPTAVVPTTATGEQVAAVVPTVAPVSDYTVPMLGIGTFKKGDESKFKIEFTGAAEGARANVFIEPHKKGKMTEVRMRFHDLKEAPKGLAYILWAVSPDNQFQRLGSIVNVRGRNEAEIKSETAFDDFGLLLTTEDVGIPAATLIKPAGVRVGVFQIIR
jgi:hypothetical protein